MATNGQKKKNCHQRIQKIDAKKYKKMITKRYKINPKMYKINSKSWTFLWTQKIDAKSCEFAFSIYSQGLIEVIFNIIWKYVFEEDKILLLVKSTPDSNKWKDV